ncbi:LptA/OstA family protein [Komagataeibacter medellinensis]|uniref:Organic solvent tolerance-like N-terminal domain-containing protein n=1 Tax=Komagataeibacter medellinensis (strain NBRC 3288 / BCRC 11682 / LMG 1693 / Kondo 51) TaxID=634177 RepID=G2I2N9_KOMMN|nr:LptA/OstA family protein [Komagataeibacter medellinensis]BAK85018.1 hypothetical protein GLX_26060 [Komagataeibacter medellinensis NBRC 3288]
MARLLSPLPVGGILLGLVAATPVMAQGLDMSHGQQINVTAAGGFNWDQNAQTVTAYDRAQAIRGDMTVRADRLVAFYRKKAATAATTPGAQAGKAPVAAAQPPDAKAPLADHLGVAPPLETRRPHITDDGAPPTAPATIPPPTPVLPNDPDVDTSLTTTSDTLPQDMPTPDRPPPTGVPGGPATGAPSSDASGDSNGPGGASEVYRLEALGHVHAFTTSDQAWGDHAVYDVDQAILVMTGQHLKMTTPQDILTARDVLEYHSHEHMSVARGNATMTTDDGRQLRADVLVGYDRPKDQRSHPRREWNDTHPNGKKDTPVGTADDRPAPGAGTIDHVDAFGHIVIRTRTETVTGDRGVYVPDTGIARLVGNVHITRGENQVSGTSAIVNMHTDIATLTDNPGSRVSGLVIPNQAGKGDKGSAR